jgi:hypothetical protein
LSGEKKVDDEELASPIFLRRSPLLKMAVFTPSISMVWRNFLAIVDLPLAGSPTITMTSFPFMTILSSQDT